MSDIGMFIEEQTADESPIVEMQLNTQLPGLYFCFYCKKRGEVLGCKIISVISPDVLLVRSVGTSCHGLIKMSDLLKVRARFCASSADLKKIGEEVRKANQPKLFGKSLEEYIEKYIFLYILPKSLRNEK